MRIIVEFLILFVVLYFVNYIILSLGKTKYKKGKNIPLAIYFKKVYDINITKSKYVKSIWLFALVNTFIIDTSYIIIIYLLKNNILRIIFGIIVVMLLMVICYGLVARIMMVKEGKKDV